MSWAMWDTKLEEYGYLMADAYVSDAWLTPGEYPRRGV
jgi:hypothetical protein